MQTGEAREQSPTSSAAMASPFRGIRDDPFSRGAPTDAHYIRHLRGDAATAGPSTNRGVGRIGAGIPASHRDGARLLFRSCSLHGGSAAHARNLGIWRMLSSSEVSSSYSLVRGRFQRGLGCEGETRRENVTAEIFARSRRCKRRSCSMTRWLFVGSSRRGGCGDRSPGRRRAGRVLPRDRISSAVDDFSGHIRPGAVAVVRPAVCSGARRNVTRACSIRPNPRRTQPGREHRDTGNRKQP